MSDVRFRLWQSKFFDRQLNMSYSHFIVKQILAFIRFSVFCNTRSHLWKTISREPPKGTEIKHGSFSIFSTLSYVSSNPVHDWSSAHITPLLQPLHWLPIRLRNLISVLPPSRYDLRRNNGGIFLSTPKRFTKVTMVDRSFMAVAGHGFGTVFPLSIRSDCTKSYFKQKLTTFLFSKTFG